MRSISIAAIVAFALAQSIAGALALEHAVETDHESHSCQICQLAERDGDGVSPAGSIHKAPIGIPAQSTQFVLDVVPEHIFLSAHSRAPPHFKEN